MPGELDALREERDRLRAALMEIDARTPTQSFVESIRAQPQPWTGFADTQQALANIGDIARAALHQEETK